MGFLPIIQKAARSTVEFLQELARIGAPAPEARSLSERLIAIRDKVGYLQKDGKNSGFGGGYKYVSHDAVVDAVGDALVEFGVAFGASITGKEFVATGSHDKNQNPVYRTFVFTKYSFSVPETGETREYAWMGDAMDSLDKGLYKAITQSKKTFLLNFFLIATGDEKADADQVDPDFKGRGGKSGGGARSNQPTARPNGNGQGQAGKTNGNDAARAETVARISKIARGDDGKVDWGVIGSAVSSLHSPGPFDAGKPSFQGWTLQQLNDLAWALADGDDAGPAGGTDQWR